MGILADLDRELKIKQLKEAADKGDLVAKLKLLEMEDDREDDREEIRKWNARPDVSGIQNRGGYETMDAMEWMKSTKDEDEEIEVDNMEMDPEDDPVYLSHKQKVRIAMHMNDLVKSGEATDPVDAAGAALEDVSGFETMDPDGEDYQAVVQDLVDIYNEKFGQKNTRAEAFDEEELTKDI